MKILLIVPTHNYKFKYPSFLPPTAFPIGMAYIAAALKQAGHEVFGLNPNNDPSYACAHDLIQAYLTKALDQFRPDAICTGGICVDYQFLLDAIQIIREKTGVPIILGGGIVNNDPAFIFSDLHPDFCVIGEGEEIVVQLASKLAAGETNYEQIPNLGFWRNGQAEFSRREFEYPDLDLRPFPYYEPFNIRANLDHFSLTAQNMFRYTRAHPRPIGLITGRSCPFSCTFCISHREIKYRARNIPSVMQEIRALYEQYEFNIVMILDEFFTPNRKRLVEFSTAVLAGKEQYGWDFDWFFVTHFRSSLDQEALSLAKRAGCYMVAYGLESASPKVLESMRKQSNPHLIAEAIRTTNAANLAFQGNFIFGDIAETPATAQETMTFFDDHCRHEQIVFDYIRPYPGSLIFDQCLERGLIRDKKEYYRRIDEGIVNMTAMSNWVWLPWVSAVGYLGGLGNWLKSATALAYETEPDTAMTRALGTHIYAIHVECPHCGQKLFIREMLGSERIKKISSYLSIGSTLYRCLKRIKTRRWFVSLFSVGVYLLSWFSSFYRAVLALCGRQDAVCLTVITGCTKCHKRFRANLR